MSVMFHAFRSPSLSIRALTGGLCVYLTIWMAGCAGAPPHPEGDQLTRLQVRTYPVAMKNVFNATVDAAQDLDFSVDLANADAGVLTATRQTSRSLARITRADDEGWTTWMWIACIATGVIIIAAAVILLTSDDDDKKDEDGKKDGSTAKGHDGNDHDKGTKDKGKASRRGGSGEPDDEGSRRDTVRVKYKEKRRSEPVYRHRERSGGGAIWYPGYEEPDADFIVISEDSPRGKEWHQYRITVHFDNPSENDTKVRLSVQGAYLDGEEVAEAGPVYDPKFYDMFFSTLEQSLREQAPDSTAR